MSNEYAELDGLTNPDQRKRHFYDWPDEFLQRILGSLMVDEYFLIQGKTLIKPEYFRQKAHYFICKTILDFYDKYGGQPSKITLEKEIREYLKDSLDLEPYLGELDAICFAYVPGLQEREYFLDQITEFAKTQSLRIGYDKTLTLFRSNKRDKWVQIREILEQSLLVERNIDLGLDYFESIEERYKRVMKAKEEQECFPTGFGSFDEALHGGLNRGEMGAFAGMSGSGKSLALVKVAKTNLMRGRHVALISAELEEDSIGERFDSMLTTVPIRSLYTGATPNEVAKYLREERESGWGDLRVKQFPAGTADVTTIRAYMAQLHLRGFRSDVVIVDYIGELRDAPGIKIYESRQRLVRDLRGMATELKVCVFTAMQVNRAGRDAMKEQGFLDDDVLADSAGQVRPLDALWTISQNDHEQKAGVGTLFASKHRSGQGRFRIFFEKDIDTLEMKEITQEKYQKELSKVAKKSSNEVGMESFADDSYFKPNKGNES